jgi:hypothetical protein
MNMHHTTPVSASPERRKVPRHPDERRWRPLRGMPREFGIGYGRSSGYARVRSYIDTPMALFRCR